MILEPRHITLIEAGRKTRITRPKNKWSSPPKVGQSYPVQKRVTEKKHEWSEWDQEMVERLRTECYVKCTATFECLAHEIDDDQAKQEGHKDRETYFTWFQDTYGQRPEFTHRGTTLPIEIPVVVACIVLDEQNWLAPGHVDPYHLPTNPHGYQRHPAGSPDNAECPPRAFLEEVARGEHKSPSQRAFDREQQERIEALNDRPLEEQLAEVRRMAQEKGIDLSRQERELKGRIGAMRRKVERRAA